MSMENKRQIFSANRMLYRRKNLRQKSTPAERILWHKIRKKSLGYKFKRQFSIDNYVVDFYCPDKKLAIELDGEIHKQRKVYDEYRTRYLKAYGVMEIRFKNIEIIENLGDVVEQIKAYLPLSKSLSCA